MKKAPSQSPVPVKPSIPELPASMNFPRAIQMIIEGKKVRRTDWTDEQEYCLLKDNFLMIHRGDRFHTWIVAEGDLLAIDWVIKK